MTLRLGVSCEVHASQRRDMSKLVENVTRTFPGVHDGAPTEALVPTSLAVADNDFITILGPSGCGKSTLLRIIAGLDVPTSGRVLLDGVPVTGPSVDRGMVFQSYTLFPVAHDPRERVLRTARARAAAGAAAGDRALTGSTRSGSPDSSATIRRCCRAACSSARRSRARSRTIPKILLLDEPFGALDNQTRSLMQELLLSIWESDRKTVLFVTHDIEEAIFMASRVVVMSARPGRSRPTCP